MTELIDATVAWAQERQFPPLLALSIIAGESGFNPYAIGDGGTSFGAIQVHVPAHGGTRESWSGVDGALRSLDLMWSRWNSVWQSADKSLWEHDPVSFLLWFWPRAQGAVQMTRAVAQAAYEKARDVFRQKDIPAPMPDTPKVPWPTIEWVGAHPDNFSTGRGGYAPEIVVLHIAQGSFDGVMSWFLTSPAQRGSAGSSAHFSVAKDGRVRQHVRIEDTAWSNGQMPGATAAILAENPGVNANKLSISIEHEGNPGDKITPEQWDASTRLTAALFDNVLLRNGATGVAVDRTHIEQHKSFSPKDRAFCPGWGEGVQTMYIDSVRTIIDSAHVLVPAPTPEPPPVPEPPPAPVDLAQRFRALYLQELRDRVVAWTDLKNTIDMAAAMNIADAREKARVENESI